MQFFYIALFIIIIILLKIFSLNFVHKLIYKFRELNYILSFLTLASLISFIILFICYNNKSIEVYEKSLGEIKGMYYTNYQNDTNSIISNYNIINNRILFLQERIAHYQNNANHFASLWMAFLSLLFVIVTGFNLFNFNEKKKELNKLHAEMKKKSKTATKLINDLDTLKKELIEDKANESKEDSPSEQIKNAKRGDYVQSSY